VTTDGRGVVSHAGTRLLADVADAAGVSAGLSEALTGLRERRSGHDPGRVLTDVAVMLADGGEAISDLGLLRNQPQLFGWVASTATAWRVLDGIDDAALDRVPRCPGRGAGASVVAAR
jgi:Transposase DDE domain group 1